MNFNKIKDTFFYFIRQVGAYFNSLEEREKYILIAGLYAVLIIGGIFLLTDKNFQTFQKVDKKWERELANYMELRKLASEYLSYKKITPAGRKISLKNIEDLAREVGIKDKIVFLKPFEKEIEIRLRNLTGAEIIKFLKVLHKRGLNISRISIEKERENSFRVKLSIQTG